MGGTCRPKFKKYRRLCGSENLQHLMSNHKNNKKNPTYQQALCLYVCAQGGGEGVGACLETWHNSTLELCMCALVSLCVYMYLKGEGRGTL